MGKNKQNFLKVVFEHPMDITDWAIILSRFQQHRGKRLTTIFISIDGEMIQEVQISASLSDKDEYFLRGLIVGHAESDEDIKEFKNIKE